MPVNHVCRSLLLLVPELISFETQRHFQKAPFKSKIYHIKTAQQTELHLYELINKLIKHKMILHECKVQYLSIFCHQVKE